MSEKKEYSVGWLWVVAIVVVVAIVLYVNQQTSPVPEEPAEGETDIEIITNQDDQTEGEESNVPLGDYTVQFTYTPEAVQRNNIFGLEWDVVSPNETTTTNSALYFGTTTRVIAEGTNPSPEEVNYPGQTYDDIGVENSVPGSFESNIPAYTYATTVYVRAHAEIDGVHYWSNEVVITVK